MKKVFLYLYPIKEYASVFNLGDEYYDYMGYKRPFDVLNETIEKRYRQKGYEIIYALYPDKNIYGYVGGLHLYYMTNQKIKEVIRQLDESGIEYIATGRCTKDRAYKMLKDGLGDKVHQFRTGLVIEV